MTILIFFTFSAAAICTIAVVLYRILGHREDSFVRAQVVALWIAGILLSVTNWFFQQ